MSKKCKNNMNLNVQPCHCKRSEAIHVKGYSQMDCHGLRPRNDNISSMSFPRRRESRGNDIPHCHAELGSASIKHLKPPVISRLTGNPGNKDFNASWMPDRVGHDSGIVSQSGRSMVEMLGTLAIVGVLSAGAIGGYSYAMNKHRTNELIYEATKRAQWVGTQLEMNKNAQNIGFGGFGTDTFGGGKFTGTVKTDLANPNQFGIVVSALREAVCENIVKGLESETNGVIRAVKTTDGTTDFDVDNCDDNAEFLLVFNRDLSTSDSEITPNEPEVSGEVSEQATETANPETVPSDRKVHCNDHGEWDGNACDCDAGYDGETCSIEINNEPDEPEETIATEATEAGGDAECSYHGTWYGSWCSCNTGWGGSDCSEDHRNDCGEHGSWSQWKNNGAGGCDCNSGWGGSDCSEDKSNACSGHGTWQSWINNFAGGCACDSGWVGSDCSVDHTCSGHGDWQSWRNGGAGGCWCNGDWGGSDCSIPN